MVSSGIITGYRALFVQDTERYMYRIPSEQFVTHINKDSIRTADLLLIPVIHNNHWTLLSGSCTIHYPKHFYEETQKVFDDNDIRQWPIRPVVDAPTQKNSFDCIMFVCKYMEAVVKPQGVIWEDLKNWQDSISKFRAEFTFILFCAT
ncbi:hypothetical protein IEQ34_019324 [Dendrobium chrysotoxum]|uniref:Ubiquitin-like protease family profile domain-containing protein n=1 Tax=Dendrobium chrysotoxum TaxID=161865 RepID=A0AAV7FQY4_DENCH|nr:hypothetical protein IEQ34_019324 [Dendrobium chrysotoxum]